jgi:hypothetical protein
VRTSQKYVELPEPFLAAPRQILIPLPTKTEVGLQFFLSSSKGLSHETETGFKWHGRRRHSDIMRRRSVTGLSTVSYLIDFYFEF